MAKPQKLLERARRNAAQEKPTPNGATAEQPLVLITQVPHLMNAEVLVWLQRIALATERLVTLMSEDAADGPTEPADDA